MASNINLVTGTETIKLRKTKRRQERARQLDSKRLKNDELKTAFQLELRNRFSALEEEEEINIANFNQAIREAGVKVLRYQTKKRKEWMKQDTWTQISERKETKMKNNATRSQRLKDRMKSIPSVPRWLLMEVLKEKYEQDCRKVANHSLHSETSGNMAKFVRKKKPPFQE